MSKSVSAWRKWSCYEMVS